MKCGTHAIVLNLWVLIADVFGEIKNITKYHKISQNGTVVHKYYFFRECFSRPVLFALVSHSHFTSICAHRSTSHAFGFLKSGGSA